MVAEIRRISGELIARDDNLSVKELCEANRANLGVADLSNADLRGGLLRGANLVGSCLRGADLHTADLGHCDLGSADLREANLGDAYLFGAHFGRRANLRGALLSWCSHDLCAELLFRAAGDDVEKRKIAGLVLISRDYCWDKEDGKPVLEIEDPLKDWALDVLAEYVIDGDYAPDVLRERARALVAKTEKG